MIHLVLTPHQLATIKKLLDQQPPDIPAKRLLIVRLAADGMKAPEIAKTVGLHEINVRKWLHRYEQRGVDGLRNQTGAVGRPRLLTAQQRTEIARLYATNPREMGFKFMRWTLSRLQAYLIESGMVEHISVETIRQCVNEAKI